jgi:hypothetical protein
MNYLFDKMKKSVKFFQNNNDNLSIELGNLKFSILELK